jgi:hypothetical protein
MNKILELAKLIDPAAFADSPAHPASEGWVNTSQIKAIEAAYRVADAGFDRPEGKET